jgi:hypothetical protein
VILQVNQYGSVLYEARLTPLESRVNETIKACRMNQCDRRELLTVAGHN